MTGKTQDFPTGEGYWAFEGHLIDLPDIQYRELTEVFTIKDRLVANLKDRGAWPVEWLIGTFTRVYMPWETQPAPTLSPATLDVCESAIIESMGNRGAMTDAEFDQWQVQCKAALDEVQAMLYVKDQAWRDVPEPAPTASDGMVTLHENELNRRIAKGFDMGVEVKFKDSPLYRIALKLDNYIPLLGMTNWQRIEAAIDEYVAMRGEQQPAPSVSVPVEVLEAMRYAIGYQLDIQETLSDGSREWLAKLRKVKAWLDEQGGGSDGC